MSKKFVMAPVATASGPVLKRSPVASYRLSHATPKNDRSEDEEGLEDEDDQGQGLLTFQRISS